MGKIDKNRTYGQVIGVASHVFEQDGKMFDAAGEEICETSFSKKKKEKNIKK
jgi:hypothetical protein